MLDQAEMLPWRDIIPTPSFHHNRLLQFIQLNKVQGPQQLHNLHQDREQLISKMIHQIS